MKIICCAFPIVYSSASFAAQNHEPEAAHENEQTVTVESTRPWWIGDLFTIVSIVTGFVLIAFQLNRQHKNDIEAQKENNRDQLRLEIYQEFSQCLDNANSKISEAAMYAFLLPTHFITYTQQVNSGINPSPPKERAGEYSDLYFAANESVTKLMKLIEKYEIVSPDLEIFKLAIHVAIYDINESNRPLFDFLLRVLPRELVDNHGNTQIVNVLTPTQAQIDELKGLVDAFKGAHDDLAGYLFDLNVELQKIFLSKLFPNVVKERKPIDPRIKVASTDPIKMQHLKDFFENETPWGIEKKKVEASVRANLENP